MDKFKAMAQGRVMEYCTTSVRQALPLRVPDILVITPLYPYPPGTDWSQECLLGCSVHSLNDSHMDVEACRAFENHMGCEGRILSARALYI